MALNRRDLFCARCGERHDFLTILNQHLHPEHGSHANSLFLEGVGCPACDWGREQRITLPRTCWNGLKCAAYNIARISTDDGLIEQELAAQLADAILHERLPEYVSLFLGVDEFEDADSAWDWFFGNGFQHRLQAVATFARGGAFSVSEGADGRVLLSRPESGVRQITGERLGEAKAAVHEIVEPRVLMSVLHSRMRARGFSDGETSAALDAIAKERLVYIRNFEHPLLTGGLQVSFQPGRG